MKMRFHNLLQGFKSHISNIWSLLDVLVIIFNTLAVFLWIKINDK